MVKSIAVLIGGCMALLGSVSVAADGLKIGYVNAPRVFEEAPQAKQAKDQIEQEFAPRDEELKQSKQELQKMEEKLSRDGAIMSESKRRALEREIRAQRREIRRTQEAFREDLNIRRNEELSKLQRQVREAIRRLAEKEGYDLVVSNGVLFSSDRINITGQVLEMLEQRQRGGS